MADEPQQPTTSDQQPTANQPKGFNWKVFLMSGGCGVIIASLILLPLLGLGIYYFFQHGLPGLYGGQPIGYIYVPDEYIPSLDSPKKQEAINSITKEQALSIIGNKFHVNDGQMASRVEQIMLKAQEKQINPGIILSVWGKEQGFGNPNFAFGYGSSSNFESQLEGMANTLVKAINNTYGESCGSWDNDTSKPIFARWIDCYTPLSDPRNSHDRMNFAKYLKAFIPNQIIEEQAPGGGGGGGWSWVLQEEKEDTQCRADHSCFMLNGISYCASDLGNAEGFKNGDPVLAVGDGTITFRKDESHYGNNPYLYVRPSSGEIAGYNAEFVSSDNKIEAFYAHIYRPSVATQPSFSVKGGQQFATIYPWNKPDPEHEKVTNSHLHFELKINGQPVSCSNQLEAINKLKNGN